MSTHDAAAPCVMPQGGRRDPGGPCPKAAHGGQSIADAVGARRDVAGTARTFEQSAADPGQREDTGG
ncbi:hypothetical protein K3728_08255 [Rhodobacteraceae bacterium M385]|nr:hypothetical protein K3728_08255 [Rhodobacteraceae bacterium M385]